MGKHFLTLFFLACLWSTSKSSEIDLADWASKDWFVTVDGVMGGKSSGKLELLGGTEGVVFSGDISLDGGGFSSIRRTFSSKDLSGHAGVVIEVDAIVTGNGDRMAAPHGVTLQLDRKAAAFAVPVAGASGRATIFLPFSAFRHIIYRGTRGPLDTSSVSSMDVYVLYQPGPFSVTLRSIVAVENNADQATVPLMDMSNAQVEALIESTIERGSVAYNKDQIEVCGAIYQSAMRTIALASGAAPEVKEVAATALAVVRTKQYDVNWGAEPAWIYRKGFDAMLSFYGDSAMPSDDDYPAYAAGTWAVEAMDCSAANTCGARTEAEMASSTANVTAPYSTDASWKQQPLDSNDAAVLPAPGMFSAVLIALVSVALCSA